MYKIFVVSHTDWNRCTQILEDNFLENDTEINFAKVRNLGKVEDKIEQALLRNLK